MGLFGETNHNVDINRLDSQQKYIYDYAWNAAIEKAALELEEKFDFVGNELLAAQQIRKLKR